MSAPVHDEPIRPRRAQDNRAARRWRMLTLIPVAVVLLLAGWALGATESESDTTRLAAATTADLSATHARMEADLIKARAELVACKRLAGTALRLGEREDQSYEHHHQAHMLMRQGKISEAERNRRWQKTLSERAQLSPVFRDMVADWKRECA